jgi:hypothetical protein
MTQQSIEPTYTTSEQSKLLKEKGFDVPTAQYHRSDGEFIINSEDGNGERYSFNALDIIEDWNKKGWVIGKYGGMCFGCNLDNKKYFEAYSAPEQWQVCEWLRHNHGIWILVLPQDRSGVDFRINKSEYPSHALFFSIIKYEKNYSCKELINTSNDKGKLFLHFDTPQEAYSAAFDYILKNNLI